MAFDFSDIGSVITAFTGGGAPWGWAMFGATAIALIKIWPVLQLQAQNAKQALRGEEKDQLHNCNERLDAMSEQMNRVVLEQAQMTIKMNATAGAYHITSTELERIDPENAALKHGRLIFGSAWSTEPVE